MLQLPLFLIIPPNTLEQLRIVAKKFTMTQRTAHTFHIPVMGLSYTIDSPIKVARFGISSVVSIMEDHLIEIMRKHYCHTTDRHYEPITTVEPDYRAKRITAYLDLMNAIVTAQMQKIRSGVCGREINCAIFSMLRLKIVP